MKRNRQPWWRRIGWMGLSCLCHALILLSLAFVPIVEKVRAAARERRPEAHLSARTLEMAAHKLREINRNDIERRVAALDDVARQMAQVQARRAAQLADYAVGKPAAALTQARALAAQILALQAAVRADQPSPQAALSNTASRLTSLLAIPGTDALVQLNDERKSLQQQTESQQAPLDALASRMDGVLALQVQLADALAWSGQPSLTATATQAQTAQQRAKDHSRAASARMTSVHQIAQWDLPGTLARAVETRTNPEPWAVETRGRAASTAGRMRDEVVAMATHALDSATDQDAALAHMRDLIAALQGAAPGNPLSGELATLADGASATPDTADIPALYAHATATEARVVSLFQSVRAAELTLVTGLAPARARAATAMDTPPRPAVAARTFRDGVHNDADYAEYSAQLRTILGETESMLANAVTMLTTSGKRDEQDARGVDVAQDYQDRQAQARDNLGIREDAPPRAAPDHTTAATPAGDGSAPRHGNWPYGGRRTGDAGVRLPSFAGRGVTPDGSPGLWFHMASWYTLGPFTTGQGADVARRYSPEQLIDLDATYKGPDGRTLAWTYVQAPGSIIAFPEQADSAVYYAYGEVRFDTACDLWVAVASDDRSELALNGEIVWIGEYFSDHDRPLWPFPIGDQVGSRTAYYNHFGFRRVSFKAGVNRLLMRVENGGGGCAFSVLVATTNPVPND